MPPHRPEHRYEEISMLAYHLWQKAQCPPGEDLKFWLQAEQQLFGKRAPQSPTGGKAPVTQKSAAPTKASAKTTASTSAKPAAKATAKSPPKTARQQARA
ncbi:MAG: DUF2934 domain-containing protein [Prosthecobacter sp.]|uniref:DUF2934 domain-containing protein n=1 Tax=Prosthecobacter sp. TaxID=1965333 RepID=UPI0025CBC248|nr:DUF2934 domain-containing protein [Prosthecobacter sp.]MCF7787173.1 DUF2934 domain-containing protein [Prosthecobacter sp.]